LNTLAVSLGSYDHKSKIAYVVEVDFEDPGIRNIVEIDFLSGEYFYLRKDEYIIYVTPSYDRKSIAFAGRDSLKVINIEDRRLYRELPGKFKWGIHWSQDSRFLTSYDSNKDHIVIYDLKDDAISTYPLDASDMNLLKVEWASNKGGFLYHFFDQLGGDGDVFSDSRDVSTYLVSGGKLSLISKHQKLDESGDGDWGLSIYSYAELGNYAEIYRKSNPSVNHVFDSTTSLDASVKKMWSKDFLRTLGWQGFINLEAGEIVPDYSRSIRSEGSEKIKFNFYDVAADFSNYVLMYNKKEKVYVVQDIRTGKLIERFDNVKLEAR